MAECNLLYEQNEPKILVTVEALYKMRYYINNTADEIGWLGYVSKLDNNRYLIEDVFLLKQKVHSTTTEIDPEALANLATSLIKQGQEGIALYNKIRVWGHSHVNMSTSPSGQDDSQMNEFATSDFYIRLIGNKKGEWNVCLYDYANNILWSELDLELFYNVEGLDEALDKEIKDNVSKITYNTPTTAGFSTTRSKNWWYDDEADWYNRYYGGYSPNTKGQADKLREEKEAEETQEEKEKLEEPYLIEVDEDGFIDKEDYRNLKRYYASDEDLCLFFATADTKECQNMVKEDFGIILSEKDIVELADEMLTIWNNKYGGGTLVQ